MILAPTSGLFVPPTRGKNVGPQTEDAMAAPALAPITRQVSGRTAAVPVPSGPESGQPLAASVAELPVLDANGRRVPFGALFRERRAIVVFVRVSAGGGATGAGTSPAAGVLVASPAAAGRTFGAEGRVRGGIRPPFPGPPTGSAGSAEGRWLPRREGPGASRPRPFLRQRGGLAGTGRPVFKRIGRRDTLCCPTWVMLSALRTEALGPAAPEGVGSDLFSWPVGLQHFLCYTCQEYVEDLAKIPRSFLQVSFREQQRALLRGWGTSPTFTSGR